MPAPAKTLYIFPDAQRLDAALQAAAAGADYVDARGYLTWSQWLERCAPAQPNARGCMSPVEGAWLLRTLMPSTKKNPFGDFVLEPRFAAQAWDLIQHLKRQLATSRHLESAAAAIGAELGAKAHFFAALWNDYDAALGKLGRLDGEDVIRLTAASFDEAWPSALQGVRRIELLHFYDFPRNRLGLVLALAKACAKHGVQLAIEAPGGGPDEVDALANEVFAPLERASNEWEAELRKSDATYAHRPLANVAQRLFGGDQPDVQANGLKVLAAATSRDELREIARGIRARVDEGCAPETLAVAFRDLGPEAEGLTQALAHYGVPARARRGVPLATMRLGRLALELPRFLEHDFPLADLLRWLEDERFATRHSPPEGALGLLQHAGLRDNALGADGKRGAYAVRLGQLKQRSPSAQKARVEKLETCVQALITAVASLREPRRPEAFLEAWWKVLETLGVFDKPSHSPELDSAHQHQRWQVEVADQRAQHGLQQLKRDFTEALALRPSSSPMTLHDWGRWLNQAAASVSVPVAGPRAGAVSIIDLRELAGLSFRHLWIGGMTEGRIPSDRASTGVLTDGERRALNAAAEAPLFRLTARVGMNDSIPLRLAEDRLLFHISLSAAEETVTLTASATDAAGRPVLRSSFIDDLERRMSKLDGELVQRRAVPVLENVRTETELRQRAALESVTSSAERSSPPHPHGEALVRALAREPWLTTAKELAAHERERIYFHADEEQSTRAFSGRVESTTLVSPLTQRFTFDAEHPVSASWLEKFGNCRFQGFTQRLLLGRDLEETGEDTPHSVHGQLLHAALEHWVQAWNRLGAESTPDDAKVLALLDAAVASAAESLQREQPVGHPRLWALTVERSRQQLRRLWQSTRLLAQPATTARLTEVSFGKENAPATLLQVRLPAALDGEHDIYLHGNIDRWDQGPSQQVVDYKRGKWSSGAEAYRALGLTEFQLPLYLLAIRQAAGQATPLDASWLQMRHRKELKLSEVLEKAGQTLAELLATDAATRVALKAQGKKNLANDVHELVAKLRVGDFGARPQDCKFCGVKSICRISVQTLAPEGEGP